MPPYHLVNAVYERPTANTDNAIDFSYSLFYLIGKYVPWIPTISLPGSLRITPKRIKKRIFQFWVDHHKYEDRILVVGNKLSEHLFTELNIDAKKVQTTYNGPKQGRCPNN